MKGKHFGHAFVLHFFFFFKLSGPERLGINTKIWVDESPNPHYKTAVNFLNYIIVYYGIMMITNMNLQHMSLTNGLTRIML